jgi:hypothetical protein
MERGEIRERRARITLALHAGYEGRRRKLNRYGALGD